MKRLLTSVAAAVLLVTTTVSALAQDYSEDHLQAAEELLDQIDMHNLMATSIDGVLDAQLEQNPQLAPYKDVMRSFMQEHMGWQSLKEPFTRIYAEAFTEEELREITAFYRTETGRKAAELTPVLMSRGMELGQKIVEENTPELERRLLERARELEGSK